LFGGVRGWPWGRASGGKFVEYEGLELEAANEFVALRLGEAVGDPIDRRVEGFGSDDSVTVELTDGVDLPG